MPTSVLNNRTVFSLLKIINNDQKDTLGISLYPKNFFIVSSDAVLMINQGPKFSKITDKNSDQKKTCTFSKRIYDSTL